MLSNKETEEGTYFKGSSSRKGDKRTERCFLKPRMVAHACYSRAQEEESGGA